MSPRADTSSSSSERSARRRRRPRAGGLSPADAPDAAAPRTGAKRTVTDVVREFPNYLRLLYGLMVDRRVPRIDKLLVAGAVAYILLPLDLMPDFIPFLGEVDDVFLLMVSLQRLVENAGRRVLLDHWAGDPEDLEDLNIQRVIAAAAFFLPRRIRRRLQPIGRF